MALAGLPATVADVIPYRAQEAAGGLVQSFMSLYPANFFVSFQFAMVEDLINSPPFTCFGCWLRDQELSWDDVHSTPHQRLMQCTAEGQQAGAHSGRVALPPLLLFGRSVDEHFEAALRYDPIPTERLPLLDKDLWFAAEKTATQRGKLPGLRKTCLGLLKELHRRWACVGEHLRSFQTAAIRGVTAKRDLDFLGLLVILTSWSAHGLHSRDASRWLLSTLRSLSVAASSVADAAVGPKCTMLASVPSLGPDHTMTSCRSRAQRMRWQASPRSRFAGASW